MSRLALTLLVKDYGQIAPLALGDVAVEGIDLKVDRDTPGAMDRTLRDPTIHIGELAYSRYLIGIAQGDRRWVGIPIFLTRNFVHRCFFVARGSRVRDLADLEGKAIGTNEWPSTSNVWSRAALRERGVALEGIRWKLGPIDGAPSQRSQGILPPYVEPIGQGDTLRKMLLAGEIDALMGSTPPKGFYDLDSPIVRLYEDYRRPEVEYYQRTGVYPAHHVIGIRREVFDREPWIARSLYEAMVQSRALWLQNFLRLADSTPWLLADIEQAMALMGHDWDPHGIEPNGKMTRSLCDELLAQGLISDPLEPVRAFEAFEQAK